MVLLTVWLVWLVAVITFLVVIEHVRDELGRRAVLGSLDDDEVRTLYRGRGKEGAR